MIDPPINELLEKADCRYTLVVETAKRARQLVDGAEPLTAHKNGKPVSIAAYEINEGKVGYSIPEESRE